MREECETSGFHTDEQSIAEYQKGPKNPRGVAIQKLGFGHCGSARDVRDEAEKFEAPKGTRFENNHQRFAVDKWLEGKQPEGLTELNNLKKGLVILGISQEEVEQATKEQGRY
eukprot:10293517-Karenia_brevis.AAC.1